MVRSRSTSFGIALPSSLARSPPISCGRGASLHRHPLSATALPPTSTTSDGRRHLPTAPPLIRTPSPPPRAVPLCRAPPPPSPLLDQPNHRAGRHAEASLRYLSPSELGIGYEMVSPYLVVRLLSQCVVTVVPCAMFEPARLLYYIHVRGLHNTLLH
jgi:hypothetical protein